MTSLQRPVAATTTWTHLLARAVVTPLIGTGITPNHLTLARLLTGLAACVAIALGTPAGDLWGGSLWLMSAFLDRADGEFARVAHLMSARGHAFDYVSDAVINSLVFMAAGLGARHGWLGLASIGIGCLATVAMGANWVLGEIYQKLDGSGRKAYAGRWGFDLDDGLYLLAPLLWLHLMSFVLVGAAVVATTMTLVILVRLARLKASRRESAGL